MELDKTPPLEKGKNHICSFTFFTAENILDYSNDFSRDCYIAQWFQAFMDGKTSKLSPGVFQIGEKDVLGKQRKSITGRREG